MAMDVNGVSVEEIKEREFDAQAGKLVAQYKAGDKNAMDGVYQHYFGPIRAYVMSALGDEEEAGDAAQVVFEKMLKGIDGYEPRTGTPFRAWLFRIARNVVLDIEKSARRHRELLVTPAMIDYLREGPALETDLPMIGWLSNSDLEFFLGRLPEPQREVVLLRHAFDLTMKQIAEIVGRSPEAVSEHHRRAMTDLEQRMTAVRARRERGVRRAPMRMGFKPARVIVSRRFSLGGSSRSAPGRRRF